MSVCQLLREREAQTSKITQQASSDGIGYSGLGVRGTYFFYTKIVQQAMSGASVATYNQMEPH